MTKAISTKEIACPAPTRVRKRARRHSVSYHYAIFLVLYMLYYYYNPVIIPKDDSPLALFLSMLTLVMEAILFVYAFLNILAIRKKKQISGGTVALLVITIGMAAVSFIVNFSGLEKLLSMMLLVMSALFFIRVPLKRSEVKSVLRIFTLACIAILLYVRPHNAADDERFNPNTGGFICSMLFCAAFTYFMMLPKKRRIKKGWIYLVLCAACVALQILYSSRTSLLGIILYAFVFLFFNCGKGRLSKSSAFWIVFVFSMLGMLLAYVYAEVLFKTYGRGKLIIFDKDIFTGRQTIWNFAFESIRSNLWFGVGSKLNEQYLALGYYELIMNAHSQPIGLITSFGLPVFLLYYILLSIVMSEAHARKKNVRYSRALVAYFSVITIMSYFDIYFFSSFNWLAIMIVFSIIGGMTCKRPKRISQ